MSYAHDGSSDNIHLNNQGYCKLITLPAVQTALGCTAASYNCATVDKDLTKSARNAAMCLTYASCPIAATPGASPTASPTAAGNTPPSPTPAPPTPPARTITQEITVTTVTVDTYTGDVKRVYEAAQAIYLSLWDTSTKAVKAGCSMTSKAVAARRSGVKITFTAQANSANSDAAKQAAETGVTSTQFVSNIGTANSDLSTSIAAPTAAQITVTAATTAAAVAPTTTKEDSGDGAVIGAAVAGVVVLFLGGVAYWFFGKPSADRKMMDSSTIADKSSTTV